MTELFADKQFADPKDRVTSLELSIALKKAGLNPKGAQYWSFLTGNDGVMQNMWGHPIDRWQDNSNIINGYPIVMRYTSDELRQILEWLFESILYARQRISATNFFYNNSYFMFNDPNKLPFEYNSEADALATLILAILKELNPNQDAS